MIEAVLIRNGHRKFHDNEIPRRVCAPSRRRYFIGRHICRRQRPAFERLIINNRPQQWLRVIKATGRILPLPSPPWKPRRKPFHSDRCYCFCPDVKAGRCQSDGMLVRRTRFDPFESRGEPDER